MAGGKSSFFHFGAKTWRPKTADQQYHEIQRKLMAEQEEIKTAEVQDRIKTLEQARRLEAKTQELNELALAAELKAKSNEMQIRERQVSEAKRLEMARLEIAKHEGRESLGEADLARIRNERLKAENLAKAARDHAIRQNNRPVAPVNLGPSQVFIPPPPVPNPLPRPRSSQSIHAGHPPLRPPTAQSAHRLSCGPPPRTHPAPTMINPNGAHRLAPPQATPRMRRMSDSHAYPTAGPIRSQLGVPGHQPRGSTPVSYPNHHLRRPSSGSMSAEILLRAHAERLRRRKLETLDLKARQHNLKVQALRDLRKRELAVELRDRGIQQREIETQVNLLAERDRALNEAQLREMRDREHRLRLKEKGLQEREILDQIRRRQESDREAIRCELELLERQLQHKELLEAESAIKRAIEKGESPPMGIVRPSMEEIQTEGLLNDIYNDFDVAPIPYLNCDMTTDYGMSAAYRPRTPSGGHHHAQSHTPNIDSLSRAPSVGRRTPQLFPTSPAQSMRKGGDFLGDNLRKTPARSRSQSFDHHRPSSAASHYGTRQKSPSRERNHSLSRQNSNVSLNREEIASIARAESRAALRDHEAREREIEKAEKKRQESQRLRQELRAREENMRPKAEYSYRMPVPSVISHQRIPSMRDSLDPNYYSDSHHLDLPPVRPASRASSRIHDYDSISRPVSRGVSTRDGGLSPAPPRLGLPSRPSSRNLTAEDLGLDFGRNSSDKVPIMNAAINDQILAARLESANYNREINGGTRSRANSHVEHARNDGYLYGDSHHLHSDLSGMSLNDTRSRPVSHAGSPIDSFPRNTGGHLNPEFESSSTTGMRSRSNSHATSSNLQRDHLGAELVNTGGRLSRASSISQARGLSPNSPLNPELKGQSIGSRSTNTHSIPDKSYSSEHGLGLLTNEELAHLSTEELELILNSRGVRSSMRNEGLIHHSDEPSLDRYHELTGGSINANGMNNLGIGSSQLDQSPLFGESLYPHSPIDPPRPLSRSESSRQYEGSHVMGPHQSMRSNPNSFAKQMSNQHDRYHQQAPQFHGHDEYSNHNHPNFLDVTHSSSSIADTDGGSSLNEDDFVITEQPVPAEARIIRFVDKVQATAPRSSTHFNTSSRFDRDLDREDMHQSVRNLISKTTGLGANGIVSLRVNDTHDGFYLATGLAVILEKL